MSDSPDHLLVLPRLYVQNANAISSPMTWGFPAMSAFAGLMHVIERRLADREIELFFDSVGVICHRHEPQATSEGFVRAFHLTRNPLDKDGTTAAIVEEGRIHLEITLVFAVRGDACGGAEPERTRLAAQVADLVMSLRVAGGTVHPSNTRDRRGFPHPALISLAESSEDRSEQFRQLRRRWLPGFALVSRDDLLHARWGEIRKQKPDASLLDAWLDLSRLNMECHTTEAEHDNVESPGRPIWEARRPPGWIVPIPVGYGALGPLYEPGGVAAARDTATPFRFVESLYSIGQWVSPHRLNGPSELLWYVDNRLEEGRYRLRNDYSPNAHEFV